MASIPIIISSSPGRRYSLVEFNSSSPELPRLSDFLANKQSQKVHTPPLRPPTTSTTSSTSATFANNFTLQPTQESRRLDTTSNDRHIAPSATHLCDFWSDDDDMTPPPSNQTAFMVEREQQQQKTASRLHNKDVNTEIRIQKPEAQRPVVESTKQLSRKRRQKQTDSEKNGVLVKGKVTKLIRKEKAPHKKAEIVSRHFPQPEHQASLQPRESAGLEPATCRRTDWTPTKDSNTTHHVISLSDPIESHVGFPNLLERFRRKEEDDATSKDSSVIEVSAGDILKKRKVIELVTTANGASKKEASPRRKATKKKARTLTELATAAYGTDGDSDPLEKPARPSKIKAQRAPTFLSYDGKDKVITRRGTRKPTKPKKMKSRSGEADLPILLSPSEAMKRAGNQDFVFGTSSQLVREQSPSMIKDVQVAVQASLDTCMETSQGKPGHAMQGQTNRLWMAGARNEEGELLEIINLVDAADVPENINPRTRERGSGPTLGNTDVFLWKNEPRLVSSSLPTPAAPAKLSESSTYVQPAPEASSTGAADALDIPPRPHYELFTDAQLSREITSYGFKPIKKRATMIALLDECWESKHAYGVPPATRALSTTASTSASRKAKPRECIAGTDVPSKKSRGRPKIANTATDGGGEGNPMELEPVRVPRRGRPKKAAKPTTPQGKRKSKAPAKTIVIADSESESAAALSPPGSPLSDPEDPFPQPAIDLSTMKFDECTTSISLSAAITRAVTSAPRSTDPKQPSWHEKMLMYDPIILEDLAAWLNSGQLTRVGWNEEVDLVEVRKWCESKSVCCFLRKNSSGQERKRLCG